MPRCKAKAKGTGKQCKKDAMIGKEVCHIHGGKSKSGAAHPNYQGKGKSKYLPTRLADKYREAEANLELISVREEVAVCDARLSQLYSELGEEGFAETWKRAQNAMRSVNRARASGDPDMLRDALSDLNGALLGVSTDFEAWDEIAKLWEIKRRLVETEQKILVTNNQMISVERASLLIGAIYGIIQSHIRDKETLSAIATELRQITG